MSARQRLINEPSTNHLNFVDLPLARQNSNKFDFYTRLPGTFEPSPNHLRTLNPVLALKYSSTPVKGLQYSRWSTGELS